MSSNQTAGSDGFSAGAEAGGASGGAPQASSRQARRADGRINDIRQFYEAFPTPQNEGAAKNAAPLSTDRFDRSVA